MKYFVVLNLDTQQLEVVFGDRSAARAVQELNDYGGNYTAVDKYLQGFDKEEDARAAADLGIPSSNVPISETVDPAKIHQPDPKIQKASDQLKRQQAKTNAVEEADAELDTLPDNVNEIDSGSGQIADAYAEHDLRAPDVPTDPPFVGADEVTLSMPQDTIHEILQRATQFDNQDTTNLASSNLEFVTGSNDPQANTALPETEASGSDQVQLTRRTIAMIGDKSVGQLDKVSLLNQQSSKPMIDYLESLLLQELKQGPIIVATNLNIGFDMLAAQATLNLKRGGHDIRLKVLQPYEARSLFWDSGMQMSQEILDQADEVSSLQYGNAPGRAAIGDLSREARAQLVNSADKVITAVGSGARPTSVGSQVMSLAGSSGIPTVNAFSELERAGIAAEATKTVSQLGSAVPTQAVAASVGEAATDSSRTFFPRHRREAAYALANRTGGTVTPMRGGAFRVDVPNTPVGTPPPSSSESSPPQSLFSSPEAPGSDLTPGVPASIPDSSTLPGANLDPQQSMRRMRSMIVDTDERAAAIIEQLGPDVQVFLTPEGHWQLTWPSDLGTPTPALTPGQIPITSDPILPGNNFPITRDRFPRPGYSGKDLFLGGSSFKREINRTPFPFTWNFSHTSLTTPIPNDLSAFNPVADTIGTEDSLASGSKYTRLFPLMPGQTPNFNRQAWWLRQSMMANVPQPTPLSATPAEEALIVEDYASGLMGATPLSRMMTGMLGQALIGNMLTGMFLPKVSDQGQNQMAANGLLMNTLPGGSPTIRLQQGISQQDIMAVAANVGSLAVGAVMGTAMSAGAERLARPLGANSARLSSLLAGSLGYALANLAVPALMNAFSKLRGSASNQQQVTNAHAMTMLYTTANLAGDLEQSAAQGFQLQFADENDDSFDIEDDSEMPDSLVDVVDQTGEPLEYDESSY